MSVLAVDRPLETAPLAALALERGGASGWYAPWPAGDGWARRADTARAAVSGDWLDQLLPALEPDGPALDRIRRAAANGVVVTTGQQPGLFGGPLYTWFKAMTVLALADELERRLGIPVAPVFWAATDDSDLAEASATTVSVQGGAETIRLDVAAERDTPMAAVRAGDMSHALERLSAACGSAPNPEALERVRTAYSSGATLGGAYVRLLRDALHPLGVSVLDAAHPATRTAAVPLLLTALQRAVPIAQRLRERTREIGARGWRPQVRDVPGRTLVFTLNGAQRRRVRAGEADRLAAGNNAGNLLPNVLLRPLVERAILPTVAYVGGPAEIAYFAQVSAVAEALEVERPLIVPRWSGFLLEPHVRDILADLGAEIDDFRDPHLLESRVAREELPADVRSVIEDARAQIARVAPAVTDAVRRAELDVPAAALEGAGKQLLHKLDRLERRVLAAVKRSGSKRLLAVATARGALFPNGVQQERALNMVPFLARHGSEPLERVLAAARTHVSSF